MSFLKQKFTKEITSNYTTTDLDCGYRLICNATSDITITLHDASGRQNFDLEIDNISSSHDVVCSSKTISAGTHAHISNNNNVWTIVTGGKPEMNFTELSDTISSYTNNNSKYLIVNSTGTGVTVADTINQSFTATITTTWGSSTPPYTQTITIANIKASSPKIGVVYSGTNANKILQKEAWNMIDDIQVNDGNIVVTCFENKPTIEIPIQIGG